MTSSLSVVPAPTRLGRKIVRMTQGVFRKTTTKLVTAAALACVSAGLLSASASAQQTYTWKNVEIVGGGFVPGIIFNESEPGLVYARTDIGGAYRRDPLTRRWIPITDHLGWDDWNLTGIIALATDPVDTNRVYLAAGTYTNDWSSQNGAILRSTDKGATWQRTMLPFKLGGNMPGRGSGERLAIDPNSNNILYLGGGGDATNTFGLWKSADYGATWTQVSSFPGVGDYQDLVGDPYQGQKQGIWWVVFDKTSGSAGSASQKIYVGVASKTGPTVYQSTDGGSTWSAVPNQPGVGTLLPKKAVHDPMNGVLYIAYGEKAGPYEDNFGDVYKLSTTTGAWTRISPMPSDDSNGDNFFGYNGLSIDRQNPNIIMCTGYSSWWPDTFIFRSTNGGATWSPIWSWTRYPSRSYRYVANSSGGIADISGAPWLDFGATPTSGGRPGPDPHPKLGWMTEALAIDPFNSNHFMYGTGATIFGADDLMNWDPNTTGQINLKVMAQGLEETAVFGATALISPPSGANLISGLGDIAGFRHTDLNTVPSITIGHNPRWSTTTGLGFAELNPNYVVRVGNATSANNPSPSGGGQSGAYSTDNGQTWSPFMSQPTGVTGGGHAAVNANGTRILWSPDGVGVHVSSNNGQAWTAVSSLPFGTWQRPFVTADRVNPNRFYAFVDRVFYYSNDGGSTFTASAAAPGFPFDRVKLKAVPGREGDVWAVGGAPWDTYGIWHSTDGGLSFTKLANVEEADSIGFGKSATTGGYPAIYTSAKIAGVRGIFRSDDGGGSWIRINDDQHQWGQAGGAAITGDPRVYGRVYVGTNGRGVIYGDLGGNQAPPPAAPTSLGANVVSTTEINLSWTDNSNDETAFAIERATNSTFTAGLVVTSVGSNVTTFQATGLTPSTTYYFRVAAANAGGTSSYSNVVSATTLSEATQPPAAPSNLATGSTTGTSIDLSWTDNSSNEAGFVVERALDANFTSGLASSTVGSNVTSYTAGNLSTNTTYFFRVKATNSVGDSAYSNTATAKTKRR